MKVHKYRVIIVGDCMHCDTQTQDRLYVPNTVVVGYRKGEINFFSDEPEAIQEAKQYIKGEGAEYLGEIELPESAVLKVVTSGKAFNRVKAEFEEAGKTLVGLLQK